MNTELLSQFFIVTPLNLERDCLFELEKKMHLLFPEFHYEAILVDGGIELKIDFIVGIKLNYILKSPTRILLRVFQFKCRDFPKLFNKIAKTDWSNYFIGNLPDVEVTSKNSRLFDSRKIESAIQDGIKVFYKKSPPRKKYLDLLNNKDIQLPKIYTRIIDDVVTISLDTTGERLNIRNNKLYTGHAPIRENLAYILLSKLLEQSSKKENITLLDPMCGSGTFLIEAAHFNKCMDRSFAFQQFPVYLKNYLNYVIKQDQVSSPFLRLEGRDIDKDIIELTLKNIKDLPITLMVSDLFSSNEKITPDIVIINPPYGKRIGDKNFVNDAYYAELIQTVQNKFNPTILGIIIPKEYKIKNSTFQYDFLNGGLEVTFHIFKR